MTVPVRLSKRVAELAGCSRREAELLIEGGWVRVNGRVVEVQGARALPGDVVEVAQQAQAVPVLPVTLLLHKPPGVDAEGAGALQLLAPASRSAEDRLDMLPLRAHFARQACMAPLEHDASGLVVFSQERRIRRRLLEDPLPLEHETMVEVAGQVSAQTLQRLQQAAAQGHAKVSVGRGDDATTGLRFATKGHAPGWIAHHCAQAGLRVMAMKRIRIGRVALAGLLPGQWRYLAPHERF
jgi:23S rRNA pseudouridine2604 synthase